MGRSSWVLSWEGLPVACCLLVTLIHISSAYCKPFVLGLFLIHRDHSIECCLCSPGLHAVFWGVYLSWGCFLSDSCFFQLLATYLWYVVFLVVQSWVLVFVEYFCYSGQGLILFLACCLPFRYH